MKDGKFNVGIYFAGCALSLLGGLCFSKSQYYKGKRDAYEECLDVVNNVKEEISEVYEEIEAEEAR